MTLQQLFDSIGENPTFMLIFFIGLPIVAFVMTWVTGEEAYKSPWNFIYSGIIYAAAIPGIFATMLVAYTLFFENTSLLHVNWVVYFLPIISMIVTLLILSRELSLERIPGFDKISGLIFMIIAASMVIFLLSRLNIWVVFIGSIWHLFGLFIVLLIVFRVGFKRMFAKSE
jgi:hypothetical protein